MMVHSKSTQVEESLPICAGWMVTVSQAVFTVAIAGNIFIAADAITPLATLKWHNCIPGTNDRLEAMLQCFVTKVYGEKLRFIDFKDWFLLNIEKVASSPRYSTNVRNNVLDN